MLSLFGSAMRPAFASLAFFTILTGVAYPAFITTAAQLAFPREANGSLVERDGQKVGSALLGQPFSDPRHFWSRASATSPMPYNAAASSGSNLAPTNPALKEQVQARRDALRQADPGNVAPVPVDLVTTSASGLDPHISRAAADYQVARVARVNGLPVETVRALVEQHTERPLAGVIGEARVNVLMLNLALDHHRLK